jgi:hypothetical protein
MSKRVLVLCQRKAGLKYFKQADVDLIKELIKTLFDKDKDNIKIEYMTPGLYDESDRAEDMDYKMEFGDSSDGFIEFLSKNEKQYDAIVLGFCPVAFSYFKTKKFIADLHILLKNENSFIAYYPNMIDITSKDARRGRDVFNHFLDGYFKVFVPGVWNNKCTLSATEIRKYKRKLIKKEKEKKEKKDIIDLTMEPQFKKTKSRKTTRKTTRKSLKKSKKRGSNLKRKIKI